MIGVGAFGSVRLVEHVKTGARSSADWGEGTAGVSGLGSRAGFIEDG